jgi:hypothetical protein
MICDDCGYCVKRITEKGRTITCKILGDEKLKYMMETNILENHCVSWTPKKDKKRRKR